MPQSSLSSIPTAFPGQSASSHSTGQTRPLRYALYTRKSTEEDERQSQSIASQREQSQELARRTGLNVTEIFEEARSAKEPGRSEFNRLIALIDAGQIDGILGWHPDRLSRNEMDAAAITMRLRKGVLKDLAFVSYFFHNSPEGLMMLQIALCQSQYMVSKLAIDVKRGIDKKIQKGWYPHRAPLGYLNDKHKDKGDKSISPDPERFALLRQAWEMLLTGAYSVPHLQRILNEDWGMHTVVTRSKRGGEPLAKTTLYRLFSNVFYAGYFVHAGIIYKGAHEPMVTLDEFDRAQKIIGRANPMKSRTHTLPFTGIIRCGNCGGQVTADVRTKPSGRAYIYYHCQGKGGCPRYSTSQDRLEGMLDEELSHMDLLPEFYEWAIAEIERTSASEQAQRQAVYDQQLKALREADQMLDALLGMRLRNLIDDDEYAAKRSKLTLDRERLHQEVQECERGGDTAREACLNAAEYMKNARLWLRHGDTAMKRIVAFNLGSNYVLTEGKLVLEPHPMLVRVKDQYPALEAEYQAIKLGENGSGSTKKDAFAPVRTTWSGIWERNYTEALEQTLTFPKITGLETGC